MEKKDEKVEVDDEEEEEEANDEEVKNYGEREGKWKEGEEEDKKTLSDGMVSDERRQCGHGNCEPSVDLLLLVIGKRK